MNLKQLIPVGAALLVLASACGNKGGHGISGNIKGAENDTYAVLEAVNEFGFWYPLDSAAVGSDGDFFIPYEVPASPQLYRLRYGNSYVYIPLDSAERLSLTSTAKDFDGNFSLSGSKMAEDLTAFEREARKAEAINDADSTEAFKRHIYEKYLVAGKGDMLSYYILSRPFGPGYLIEYTDPLYAAVANNFQTYRPDDPHTKALVERAKEGQAERRKAKGQMNVMQARQIAIIDMELPDIKGNKHKLSDAVGGGKPTVLAFSSLASADNAAVTRALRTIHENGSANIYEVFFDTDHLVVENGSKGLPWTVVREPEGLNSEFLLKYNVGSLPVMFIYDSRGELSQRASSPEELHKLLPSVR